jgi:translation initiation factor IF-2
MSKKERTVVPPKKKPTKKAQSKTKNKAVSKPKPKNKKTVATRNPIAKVVPRGRMAAKAPVQVALPPTPPPTPPPQPVREERPTLPVAIQEERKHVEVAVEREPKKIYLSSPIIVKVLATAFSLTPSDLIKRLIQKGIFANINQAVSFDIASQVGLDLGFQLKEPPKVKEDGKKVESEAVDKSRLKPRPTIVTFMGHVDHGKTSLLDAIRKTKVVDRESGGITQHIGAYEVFLENGAVTFLDTPGHEAFTAMRARGAKVTDVVVIVIAADDGIKPQTDEAIDHALAADAAIIVAINKVDLPSANVDRVKKQLVERNLTPEDWGGKMITVNVSAKSGEGIDNLLDMLLLEGEMLELRANPDASSHGAVIEASLSKGTGSVATVLIQDGTLRVGDIVVCGNHYGKVRSMVNDRGHRVREATPAMPVEISGLSGVPKAGDVFYRMKSEQEARHLLQERKREHSDKGPHHHITLEDVYHEAHAGHLKILNLIIKSDVQGSLEALRGSLLNIKSPEVELKVIHSGTGNVTQSDVMLAAASNAVVIGFHVGIAPDAVASIRHEGVDVRLYQIIYEAQTAIEKAMKGLLTPETSEVLLGTAEVRQLFKTSKFGLIAGSYVTKGKIVRNSSCRVMRNKLKVYEGKIVGLKRFKDDAREVQEGFECGILLGHFKELSEGDTIDVYEVQTKKIV